MNTNPPNKIDLRELMRGSKKLILKHGDKPYLLSITRKGKLILTAADEQGKEKRPRTRKEDS